MEELPLISALQRPHLPLLIFLPKVIVSSAAVCSFHIHMSLSPAALLQNISKASSCNLFESRKTKKKKKSAKCTTNWIYIPQYITCIGQLNHLCMSQKLLLGISLHLECNKSKKFRKRNRSAKAKPDSIFQPAQNLNGLVQRQKLYLYTYYIYLKGFHWVIF